MYTKRILMAMFFGLLFLSTQAQVKETEAEVDIHSLGLYNAAQWKILVSYGKERLAAGIDFPLLRMRVGYAAFMTGNYSLSLTQYKKVYALEPENNIALYYVYLNNLYLNNTTEARYYSSLLPDESREQLGIKKNKISNIQTEFSFKMPDDTTRKHAQYARLGFGIQLGYKFELQQSVSLFNQVINEPRLLSVINNRRINISQKEYYGKLIFTPSGTFSLLGGYHYLYVPFNNIVHNDQIVFAGARYTSPYIHLKAGIAFGKITDSSYTQFDAAVSVYPLGNTRLYSITRAAYGNDFTLTEIAGFGISKKVWLEGNITIGKFSNLLENDALYVYNDIDEKRMKAGGSAYITLSKKLLLSLNYTFERKLKFASNNFYFNQHSINGGLSWTF